MDPNENDTQVDPTQDLNGTGGTADQGGTNGHPAWQEILDVLPESLHTIVTPKLQQWDQGVNQRFQQLHTEYEPLKAFKDYDPEVLTQGLTLLDRLNSDPAATVQAMIDAFGIEVEPNSSQNANGSTQGDPGLPAPGTEIDFGGQSEDPRITVLQQQLDMLMQQQQQQQEAAANAQAVAQFDAYMQQLHTQHGQFDDDFVTALIANGVPGEQAVARFQQLVNGYAQQQLAPNSDAPRVLGSGGGGGIPAQEVNVGELSSSQTIDLVTQMLANANKE